MANKKKSFSAKSIISSVVLFLLSFTIIFMSLITVMHITLFNDRTIYSKVSETTYLAELNKDVVTRCQTVAVKNGVDYSLLENVITPSRIDTDYTVYFNSMSGEDPHGGSDTIDEKGLSEEIYKAITGADSDMTDTDKENVRIASSKIAAEYKATMIVETFEQFVGFSDIFKTYSRYVFFIALALFVYLVCVTVWLNGKSQKHRLFRRFAIVCGASGLTVLVYSVFMKISGVMRNITFAPTQREYNLFLSFFDSFIDAMFVVGAGLIAVCIALIALWYMSVTGRTRK